jgi:hypothetical protein
MTRLVYHDVWYPHKASPRVHTAEQTDNTSAASPSPSLTAQDLTAAVSWWSFVLGYSMTLPFLALSTSGLSIWLVQLFLRFDEVLLATEARSLSNLTGLIAYVLVLRRRPGRWPEVMLETIKLVRRLKSIQDMRSHERDCCSCSRKCERVEAIQC